MEVSQQEAGEVLGHIADSGQRMRTAAAYAAADMVFVRKIGAFWFFLYLYAGLWLWLLLPFVRVGSREESLLLFKHFGAIMATIPMLAYVVMGLWGAKYYLYLGLGVTALIVVGLVALQPYFWLWLAFAGGGMWIGTGLVLRWRCKRLCRNSTH